MQLNKGCNPALNNVWMNDIIDKKKKKKHNLALLRPLQYHLLLIVTSFLRFLLLWLASFKNETWSSFFGAFPYMGMTSWRTIPIENEELSSYCTGQNKLLFKSAWNNVALSQRIINLALLTLHYLKRYSPNQLPKASKHLSLQLILHLHDTFIWQMLFCSKRDLQISTWRLRVSRKGPALAA